MKSVYFVLIFLLLHCSSRETQEDFSFEDTSYQIQFRPCTCKKQDLAAKAKKIIVYQGVRDYEQFTAEKMEPELEEEIIEKKYDHFLYDFTLNSKSISEPEKNTKETFYAEGTVNQKELNQFVQKNKTLTRPPITSDSSNYGSKGLELIKGFQSNRKKRQTIDELSKTGSKDFYEIRKK